MPPIFMFISALLSGISQLIEASQNKTASQIGTDIAAIDGITLAILQKNAEVKGLTIDWTSPNAVQAYVATLPAFTPIPDPAAKPAPPSAT